MLVFAKLTRAWEPALLWNQLHSRSHTRAPQIPAGPGTLLNDHGASMNSRAESTPITGAGYDLMAFYSTNIGRSSGLSVFCLNIPLKSLRATLVREQCP